MELNANLNLYRYFVAVYNARNFTRASEILSIGVPAVFRGIKELEKQVNAKLFVSLPRGVVPTKEADDLYRMVSPALNTLFKAEELINSFDENSEGTIRIACTTNLSTYYLVSHIQQFNKKYKNIQFDIVKVSINESIKLLKEHDVDFVVSALPLNEVDFKIIKIDKQTSTFFASKEFANKHGIKATIPIEQFEKLPYIAIKGHGEYKKPIVTVGTHEAAYLFVKNNVGVGWCIEQFLEINHPDEPIVKFKVNGLTLREYSYDCYYRKDYLPKPVAVFLELLNKPINIGV